MLRAPAPEPGLPRQVQSEFVPALLVKAAELHVRADLGVVDAAEHDLTSDALAALRLPPAPAAAPGTQSSSA